MIAAASVAGAAAVAFVLWRWLFGPADEPAGWDVPPADWVEEMERRRREFEAEQQQK